MAEFIDQHFENQEVEITGNRYAKCTFKNCFLVYDGEEIPILDGCRVENSDFKFTGSALNTLNFLALSHRLGMTDIVQSHFKRVMGGGASFPPPMPYDPGTQSLVEGVFFGFNQELEQIAPDDSASLYQALFGMSVDGVTYENLSVRIKKSSGSESQDDIEVYPIEGYKWSMDYQPFQSMAIEYYRLMRRTMNNIPSDSKIIMENNLSLGGSATMPFKFVVNKKY